MPKSVTLNFQTSSELVENGAIYTHYRATLNGPTLGEVFVANTETKASFSPVDPGDYTARYELSNADGSMLGPGYDFPPFSVVDDAVLNVPVGGEVIIGPVV